MVIKGFIFLNTQRFIYRDVLYNRLNHIKLSLLDRAVVVCRGTLENCYKLKQLVAVRPSIHTKYTVGLLLSVVGPFF